MKRLVIGNISHRIINSKMVETNQDSLVVSPLCANLTNIAGNINKLDPYCIVRTNSTSKSTKICKKGGAFPNWTDTLTFPADDILIIEVWDKNLISRDTLIGTVQISMHQISGPVWENWVEIKNQGKKTGDLRVSISSSGSEAKVPVEKDAVPEVLFND